MKVDHVPAILALIDQALEWPASTRDQSVEYKYRHGGRPRSVEVRIVRTRGESPKIIDVICASNEILKGVRAAKRPYVVDEGYRSSVKLVFR